MRFTVRRFAGAALATLAISMLGHTQAQAQVSVRAPFVGVDTYRGHVWVRAPFVGVYTGPGQTYVRVPFGRIRRRWVVYPPPVYVAPPPAVVVEPQLPPLPDGGQAPPATNAPVVPNPAPAANQPTPIPHTELARVFRPVPGEHVFLLRHPYTGQPVEVRVRLPQGRPRIEVDEDELEFDYGTREVKIEFERDGRVEVEYDD